MLNSGPIESFTLYEDTLIGREELFIWTLSIKEEPRIELLLTNKTCKLIKAMKIISN